MTALLHREPGATLPTATWHDWSCLVRLVVTDPAALEPAAAELATLMGRVAAVASRFRADSELSRANARAGRPVPVSRLLIRLVAGALEAADRTGGAVDPTIGGQLIGLGYDRDIALLTAETLAPAAETLAPAGETLAPVGEANGPVGETLAPVGEQTWPAAPGRASARQVRLDADRGLLTVPAGTALDLGATAKAQTADWAAAELASRYGCSVLVELGGDLAVAGAKADWQILVAELAGDSGQQVSLHSGGLATSTTTLRRWLAGGRPVHHILDPATGQPAAGPWRTVTVAAGSALAANTCSTAAIVLGEAAEQWLAGQRVAARLVDRSGRTSTVGGWPC
jgi:thiamine biosynthesis lipoprotein